MRLPLTMLCTLALALAGGAAWAETELVVLPVGATTATVKAAVAKLKSASIGQRAIDATCAGDPGCLIKTGNEVGARRVLSLTASGGRITLMLVDVSAKLLLGTRDLDIPAKRLAKELAPAVSKFVDDTITDKAKALFAEGNQHYNIGEFGAALEKYKLAYRVKPLSAFQFNIAQCHRKLAQHREAIAMYQAYLVDVPDAQNKPMVDSLIAESKKAIAEQASAETARERERLATERKKAEDARKIKEAEASATAEAAKAEQARIAAEREREHTYNQHPARKWMLITGGLGLAAIGVGAYFGVQARDAQQAFDDAGCGDPNMLLGQAALATCVDDRERGEQNAFLGNVLIGSGGAVLLTSLIVFIADPGNVERPNGPRVSITASSVKVVFAW